MQLQHPSKNFCAIIRRTVLATKFALCPDNFRFTSCSNNEIYRRDVWGVRSGFAADSTLPRLDAVT
jgi:hypothetical protein